MKDIGILNDGTPEPSRRGGLDEPIGGYPGSAISDETAPIGPPPIETWFSDPMAAANAYKAQVERTSNEWMQKAGELEADLFAARQAVLTEGQRVNELEAEVERLREEVETRRFNFNEAQAAKERVNARLRRIEEAARYLVDAYDREPVGGVAVAQLRVALEEKS